MFINNVQIKQTAIKGETLDTDRNVSELTDNTG